MQLVIIAELGLASVTISPWSVSRRMPSFFNRSARRRTVSMGRPKKTGESGTGNALLDLVRFNGFDTAKSAIKFGVFHDVEHVRVHDGMNDEQIQGIEVVVAKHFAGCAQHICKGMARDGSDQIRGGVVIFVNH